MTPVMIGDRVHYAEDAGIATLTLARPDRRNALDLPAAQALRDAAARCHRARDLRVIHLRAEGTAFCVGGDLAEFAVASDVHRLVHELASTVHAAVVLLREAGVPIVNEVHGVAAGGGFGLALSGDIILVSPAARFRAAYTAAALSPDVGLTHDLMRLVGRARAMDLVLTNRELSATEAQEWGLVSRVVPDGLVETSQRVVRALAAMSPTALAASRDLLISAGTRTWHEQLEEEADSIARLAAAPDGREGVAAFIAKRPPRFADSVVV
jgi:2-(1,2-epoxy-1,2-dihydrophenyl)acetyl-CoA isomerase